MRFLAALLLVPMVCLWADVKGPGTVDPEVARARAEIEKLRQLVDAGAVPRLQLERAEALLADAEDVALLRRTLYGTDLTPDLTDEMLAAARRRMERRREALENGKKLVDAGVAPLTSLGNFLEDLDRARKEYDLAESRARVTEELARMAEREQTLERDLVEAPQEAYRIAERFDGTGAFTTFDFHRVESAYERQFARSLPVSAVGETAVHRALGFDHRGRVDVALNPDQIEGIWLRRYLTENRIPFFAFRQAVPGKATGAHIHIGPISARIAKGG